jgi:eukaryotic-like serine/threonine-protein kinase
MSFAEGTRIGPYEIVGTLGAGGMGMVYRARQIDTGEAVALKTVLMSRTSQLSGLRREIHALMQIRHPGIVRLVDEGVHGGRPWYAMELLEGTTLSAVMRSPRNAVSPDESTASASTRSTSDPGASSTPTPTPTRRLDTHTRISSPPPQRLNGGPDWPKTLELLGLIQQLCLPLTFIHARGIVHRDLKPSNILIRASGTPVLMDFGLASRFAGSLGRESVDLEGEMRGTPAYMAPELLGGGAVIDARADLYSLGCILYEIVTGQRVFGDTTADEYVRSHRTRQPLPPSELAAVPPRLNDLVLRLLAKDPRERIGHADDIAAVLAGIRGAPAADPVDTGRGGYLYRPRMVGRERLSAQLEEAVDLAGRGQGRCILIGGESGVGKTSLATAATRFAFDHDFLVVTGACEPSVMPDGSVGGAAPLHPFRPLLQSIADYCVEHGAAATERLLGKRALVLAPYEPRLAELPGVDREDVPADLPPEGALERLFTVLAESIANLTVQRPLLLILDDLHWADDLSLKFLRQLPAPYFTGRRLLVIGTYRSDEVPAALRHLLDSSAIDTMTVGRLNEAAINSLVADMLALPEAPPTLLQFLVRHSNGNPFFVAEYLRAAVAEGLLYREAGRWQAAEESRTADLQGRMALPSSLRDLVSRRLDRLDPRAQRLVDAAATLGREFEIEILQSMANVNEGELFDALNQLLDRHVLTQIDEKRFAFAHHQIRDVAYERIDVGRRKALHGAAAAAIESNYRHDADFPLRFVGLARHWEGAGVFKSAVEYLDKAGDYALRTSAYMDTVRLLGKNAELTAKHLDRDPVRDARRQLAIGEAWIGLDDYANSRLHLGRAVSLLGFAMPESKGRLILGLFVELGRQITRRLGPARPPAPASATFDVAARAYTIMQIAWRYTENPGLVLIYTALRSVNLAEQGGSPDTRAMAFSQAVVYAATVPLHGAARGYEAMTRQALTATTDRNARSFAPIALAVYHAGIGDWATAAANADESARLALEVGFRRRREDAMSIGGFIEHMRWHPGEARRIYADLNESARRGSQRGLIWSTSALAVIALRTGDRRGAETRLRELESLHPGDLDPSDRLQLDAAAGLIAAHLDEPSARKSLDRALDALEKTPPVLIEAIDPCARLAEAYVVLMRREASLGGTDTAELNKCLTRACTYAARLAKRFPIMIPDERFWRAEADWILGQPRAALKGWQASLAAAERLHMTYHHWRAHQALAEHHPESAEASRHAARAKELKTEMIDVVRS